MSAQTADTVVIGTSASSGYYVPFTNYYHHGWTENRYNATAVNGAGLITDVAFNCATPSAVECSDLRIYMGMASDASITEWTSMNDLTLVYSGTNITIGTVAGWQNFVLDVPFPYTNASDALVVVVAMSDGGTNSNALTWYNTPASGSAWYIQNDTDPNYAQHPGTASGSSSSPADIRLVKVDLGADFCYTPSALTISDITSSSATISWTQTGNCNSWTVLYSDQFFSPDSADANYTTLTTSSSSVALSNLVPGADYYIYVQANCGPDNDSRYAYTTFHMPAGEAVNSFPWSCDFSDGGLGWDLFGQGQTNHWVVGTLPTDMDNSNQALFITPDDTTNAYDPTGLSYSWASRTINFPAGLWGISFDWRCLGELGDDNQPWDFVQCFLVPTSVTLAAGNPFGLTGAITTTPAGWINVTGDNTWQNNIGDSWQTASGVVSLDEPSTYNLAFYWRNDDNTGEDPAAAIDNILITPILCPQPVNLTDSITPSEVFLTWEAGGSESSWEVYVGSDTVVVATTDAYFQDLEANTLYNYGVRAICSSGDESFWTGGQLRTECALLGYDDFPFFENFEGYGTGTGAHPTCWNNISTYSTYTYYPYINTGGYGGSNCLYGYGPAGSVEIAVMPGIDTLEVNMNELVLTFKAKRNSSYSNPVYIGVMSNPNDLSTAVYTDTVMTTASWQTYTITFDSLDNERNFIFLQGGWNESYYYLYLDDVNLDVYSSCPKPESGSLMAYGTDSIAVTWFDTAELGNYTICWSYDRFRAHTIDSVNNISESSYVIDNLAPNTTLHVWVKGSCEDGTFSNWLYLGSTATACTSINSLPYFYGFEGTVSGSSGTIDACWRKGGNYNAYPYPYTTAFEGTRSLYFYGSGSYYNYAVMPRFSTPLSDLQVDFMLRKGAATACQMEIGAMTNPNDISTFRTIATVEPSAANVWEHFITYFADYNGPAANIAFRFSGNGVYGFLDSITVKESPLCPVVTSVSADVVTSGGARLSWTALNRGQNQLTNYTVFYTDTLGNGSILNTSDLNITLTSLTPEMPYTAGVFATCGSYNSDTLFVNFRPRGLPCLEIDTTQGFDVQIGNGTATDSYLPISSFYNYGASQQLYTADEIGAGGAISGIEIEIGNVSQTRGNWQIYLSTTNASTLSAIDMSGSDLMLVYDGPSNVNSANANSWISFDFDQPFPYDGTANLLVTIFDFTGSYVSGNTGRVHSAPGKAISRYTDSGPYTVANAATWGSQASTTNRNNIRIHAIACAQTAQCATSVAMVTNVGTHDADIAWVPGYSETQWNIDYREEGSSAWINAYTGTNLTEGQLTNLNANTTYEVRVSHNCQGVDWESTLTFTTRCELYTVPLVENFNNWSTSSAGGPSECWRWGSTYNSTYPYASSSYNVGGSGRSIYLYSTTNTYTYLVLPALDVPVDSLAMSFYLLSTTDSYTNSVEVGVLTDPDDFSTFTSIGIAAPTNDPLNQWEGFEFFFNEYPHTDAPVHIALRNYVPEYGYPYLDQVEVYRIPSCPRPANVRVTNTTQTSARVNWTSEATEFEVEYGPYGFTQGNGTVISVSDINNVTINGLTRGIRYSVYVRAICGAGDTSMWTFATHFNTQCGMIDQLPMTENFDSWGTGTGVHAPNCWYAMSTYSATYPYIITTNHTPGGAGSMYMYNSWYSGTPSTWFSLPELDTTLFQMNELKVGFWAYNGTSSYQPGIIVGVSNNPNDINSFVSVDTVVVSYVGSNGWQYYEVPLCNYQGNGLYITLKSIPLNGTQYCSPYIDDLTVSLMGSCASPMHLTATQPTTNTITLGWTNPCPGTPLGWIVDYGPFGHTAGTGTQVMVTTNPAVVTVPAGFGGDYFVRTICTANDTSDWSSTSCGFYLQQIPATVPYYYDFESAAEWSNWQVNSNTDAVWIRGSYNQPSVPGSTNGMFVSANGTDATWNQVLNNVVAWRDIDFGPQDTSFALSFDAYMGGHATTNYDGVFIFLIDTNVVMGDASNTAYTLPWGNYANFTRYAGINSRTGIQNNDWTHFDVALDGVSGVKHLVFFWYNQSNSYPIVGDMAQIDNIEIELAPCPRPYGLHTIATTEQSAVIGWRGNPTDSYEVIYRPAEGTESDNVSLITNTNSVTITGLNSLTRYAVWVRHFCDGGDTSLFTSSYIFVTDLCAGAVYDTIGTDATTEYTYPVNNFYKYTQSQTIYDSAELAALAGTDLTAIAYQYGYTSPTTAKTNVRIYLSHTSKSSFSSTSDWVEIDNDFVLVYTGALNASQGWNLYGFDTVFHYNGTDNLLVTVLDSSNAYNSSTYVWNSTSCSTAKTLYAYSDSYAVSSSSLGGYAGSKSTATARVNTMFITCGVGCGTPILTDATNVTYQGATLNWLAAADSFEVQVYVDNNWTSLFANGLSYTVTGLSPETEYQFRVRALCDEESTSDWASGTFTTTELPCMTPEALTASNVTGVSAVLSWTPVSNENVWEVRYAVQGDTAYVSSTSTSLELTDLFTNVTYTAWVRALCGDGTVESDWSEPVEFTTVPCPAPSNVTVSNVTATGATISWTAPEGYSTFELLYGTEENANSMTTVQVNGTSYTLTSLQTDVRFYVTVRTKCAENWISDLTPFVNFRTEEIGIDNVDATAISLYPNPATDQVTIVGYEGEVLVVDMTGRTRFVFHINQTTNTLDLSELTSGAYFVRMGTTVKKLIVK